MRYDLPTSDDSNVIEISPSALAKHNQLEIVFFLHNLDIHLFFPTTLLLLKL